MLIQKLRLQRGWSQQQLADLSGLSVRTIQRLEQGRGASVESLKSLAAVFEIDFSTLKTEPDMTNSSDILGQGISRDEILAFRHVHKLKSFYRHLLTYLVVTGALAVFNVLHNPGTLWVLFVALGWGVGILSHALTTFDFFPFLGPDWERRQVEKRLGRKL